MLHELWYAVRRLRARPLHTAMVVAVLAVGTGAALTVLRIANAVLLQPLPFRDGDRLQRITMRMPILPGVPLSFADVGVRALEKRTHSFADLAAYRTAGVNLTIDEKPQRVLSARVMGNFFELLGLPPRLGRGFERGDESANKPPMLVLSDRFWQDNFAADPAVIGKTVRVDGVPATIVGVADPRMSFPGADVAYWTQMSLDANGVEPYNLIFAVVARLKPGVSVEAANADATQVMRQVVRENPGPHGTRDMDVTPFHTELQPLRDDMVGGVVPTLTLLGVAVIFVLVLTCVNVAALELVRSSARRGELAIRAALGAGQRRIIAGALLEGLIQSTAGAFAGLLLSGAAVRVLVSIIPRTFGEEGALALGPWMVAGTLGLAFVCAVASTVFPVASVVGQDLQSGLRDRAGGSSRRMTRIRQGLIVAQVAAACVLVDGAVLMNLTIREAQRVDLGFEADGLLTFRLSLPPQNYQSREAVAAAYTRLTDRLRRLPGVTDVGLTTTMPLAGEQNDGLLGIEGRVFKADGSDPTMDYRIVTAGYFPAVGLKVLQGRGFLEGDSYADGTPVVINQAMVKRYFEGMNPVGQRVRTGPFAPWMSIVGVVSDARGRSLREAARPELYLPFAAPRSPMGITRDMYVVMRTRGSVAPLAREAQRAVREVNPDLPMYSVRSMQELVDGSQVREVTTTRTLTGFALVALILAAAGSYAMLMFAVVQRRREMALRQAVGATGENLVRMIGVEMGRLLAVGTGVGLAGTLAVSTLLRSFLFNVTPLDPRVFAGTILILAVAGLVAATLPARRAGAVDPMLVLRE